MIQKNFKVYWKILEMYQSNKLKLILWLIRNKNKTFGEIFGFGNTLYGDLKIYKDILNFVTRRT